MVNINTCSNITNCLRCPHSCLTNFLPHLRGYTWGRSLFDDFLMSSLNTAVPLKQVHCVAKGVGKYLNFYMSKKKKLVNRVWRKVFL